MSTSKIERALHGPSWTEVLIGAVLSALLGVVLGALYLIAKPVTSVSQVPKETAFGEVLYLQGSTSKSAAWNQKRDALLAGQPIELAEDDLNAAAAQLLEKAAGGKPPVRDPNATFDPGPLQFRVADGYLQMGIQIRITPLERLLILQSRGTFEKDGEGYRYVPSSLYLGSLPAHRVPGLSGLLLGRLKSAYPIPEDLAAAWQKIEKASLEGRVLKLGF